MYSVGSRTVQHFNQPEDTNRFLTTEVYRRHPTNRPGQINVSYGRPAEGYYLKRNPSKSSTVTSANNQDGDGFPAAINLENVLAKGF